MSKTNKPKLYRHSSSFYRLKKKCLDNNYSVHIDKTIVEHTEAQTALPINSFIGENSVPKECRFQEMNHDMSTNNISNIIYVEEHLETPLEDETDKIEAELLFKKLSLLEKIKNWSLRNKIKHIAINDLLKILKEEGIAELPLDARTLLNTPKTVNIREMGKGKFWYNGVKNNLIRTLSHLTENQDISLIFNIDGMSPFNSSSLQFWPILFKVHEKGEIRPMIAALYYGEEKPLLQDFFEEFIVEMNDLLMNGIIINDINLSIKIRCFVCDTQARSFILGKMYNKL